MDPVRRIEPGPGQESVWDYPRPPRVEPSSGRLQVVFNDVVIADSRRSLRVLETSSAPTYYIPHDDVRMDALREVTAVATVCEWKGLARHFDIVAGDRTAPKAAWTYPRPNEGYVELTDHLAFYPGRVDACYLDGERVRPQPGDYYGGWITNDIVGPFKGGSGTAGW